MVQISPNGGQITDFLKSVSVDFSSKCTETDLKKSLICPICGQSDIPETRKLIWLSPPCNHYVTSQSAISDVRCGLSLGQIAPKCYKSDAFFSSDFSTFWLGELNGINLTHLGAKNLIPLPQSASCMATPI